MKPKSNMMIYLTKVEILVNQPTCHDCGNKFVSNSTLNRHIKTVHEGKKPNKCMLCNAKFSKEVQLKKHLTDDHELEKPFDCGLPFINRLGNCNKSFKDKRSMVRHQKEVHNFTTK